MFFDTCKKQRNGHKRNYNGYYPTVLKTIFLNKHSVWVGGAVASWLVSRTLERTGFEPWSGTMWENLTNYGKVTHDGLAFCQGEVEILQAASCYRNLGWAPAATVWASHGSKASHTQWVSKIISLLHQQTDCGKVENEVINLLTSEGMGDTAEFHMNFTTGVFYSKAVTHVYIIR